MVVSVYQVYDKLRVRANIQQHMYRVAAVAKMIVDALELSAPDKHTLISAALVHDIAKLIGLTPEKLAMFHDPHDSTSLVERAFIRKQLIERYGEHEETAALKIITQLDLPDEAHDLVQQLSQVNNPKGFNASQDVFKHLREGTLLIKLLTYADWRADPQGIVPIVNRFEELWERLVDERLYNKVKFQTLCVFERELQDLLDTKLVLDSVTDETAKQVIEQLKAYPLLVDEEAFLSVEEISLEEPELVS